MLAPVARPLRLPSRHLCRDVWIQWLAPMYSKIKWHWPSGCYAGILHLACDALPLPESRAAKPRTTPTRDHRHSSPNSPFSSHHLSITEFQIQPHPRGNSESGDPRAKFHPYLYPYRRRCLPAVSLAPDAPRRAFPNEPNPPWRRSPFRRPACVLADHSQKAKRTQFRLLRSPTRAPARCPNEPILLATKPKGTTYTAYQTNPIPHRTPFPRQFPKRARSRRAFLIFSS